MRRSVIAQVVVLFGTLLSGEKPMLAIQIGDKGQAAPVQVVAPVGSEQNPVRVSGGVIAGNILHKAFPVVPKEILRKHVSGSVVMAVVIDPEGKVVSVKPISGPEALREFYIAAVRRWTYKPYLLNGLPVYVQTVVTIIMDYGGV